MVPQELQNWSTTILLLQSLPWHKRKYKSSLFPVKAAVLEAHAYRPPRSTCSLWACSELFKEIVKKSFMSQDFKILPAQRSTFFLAHITPEWAHALDHSSVLLFLLKYHSIILISVLTRVKFLVISVTYFPLLLKSYPEGCPVVMSLWIITVIWNIPF